MELFRADPDAAAEYHAQGWWGDDTVGSIVAARASVQPDGVAFLADGRRYTWADYHADADDIALAILATEPERGERIAVMMPDGPAVHAVFVGIERAGCVAVGVGARW